jgi:hypothetical protein
LALRRFKEVRWKPFEKKWIVETFVAGGSRVEEYDLKSVELSPYAWPLSILQTIHGETLMGWTAFVAEMKDGSMHSYGTAFTTEFFALPHGYTHSDIVRIHSGKQYSEAGGLQPFSVPPLTQIMPLRERPFFTCYLEGLDSGAKAANGKR